MATFHSLVLLRLHAIVRGASSCCKGCTPTIRVVSSCFPSLYVGFFLSSMCRISIFSLWLLHNMSLRCNTPHVTCHICNSDSCHFRLCDMFFPPWVFVSCILLHVIMCIAFAYVFVSCIRAFSPLSVLQSGAAISSGAPLLFSFVCMCQTFSEWTEACQVVLIYHPETTGQVSFHLEVVWYSNG